jgi:hypothetical protein
MMFVAMVVSLVVILWPRKLSNLPKDSSVETYRARIATEADAAMESKMPTNAEYWEAYLLQGIGRVKERATQVGLAATMTFVVFFFLAIASLKY